MTILIDILLHKFRFLTTNVSLGKLKKVKIFKNNKSKRKHFFEFDL